MMDIVLISVPGFFEGEERIVSALLGRFEITFHLRKPGASCQEYRSFLHNIPDTLHRKIMLHGAYPLSEQFNLSGLHFSTGNRDLAKSYPGIVKSTSVHSVQESKQLDGQFHYQFLSPVFPSISKKGYTGNLDMDEVREFLQQPRKSRVIALGGVDRNKVSTLQNMGFDGVALLGAVWGENPRDGNAVEQRLADICALAV
ncbi:MAG: thiamine phosphate synthase [Marinilabiliaceae bacterium]